MATSLPLLVFPQAKTIAPPKGNGFPSSQPHVPGHGKQVVRLGAQLTALKQDGQSLGRVGALPRFVFFVFPNPPSSRAVLAL